MRRLAERALMPRLMPRIDSAAHPIILVLTRQ